VPLTGNHPALPFATLAFKFPTEFLYNFKNTSCEDFHTYEGHLESTERFAIKKYLLIIGKKKNMQVLSHNFTYFST